MESSSQQIVFIVISSVVIIALLIFVVFDLFLIYKNRKLKHTYELLAINSKFEKEILDVKNEVSEQIFNDISSELHDSVCQSLSLAIAQINQAEISSELNPHIFTSRETVRFALNQLRNISHNLSGDYWKNFDIFYTINKLSERINTLGEISFTYNIEESICFDSKNQELIIIRILQELTTNSLRHSQASNIQLIISRENEYEVKINYSDNGIGFNPKDKSEGMGLISINERLRLLKAKSTISSDINNGFHFISILPINKKYV